MRRLRSVAGAEQSHAVCCKAVTRIGDLQFSFDRARRVRSVRDALRASMMDRSAVKEESLSVTDWESVAAIPYARPREAPHFGGALYR
jgi:hypothetical protein